MPTITVLPQQPRQGVYTSGSVVVSANPPERITGSVLISLVDMEDLATEISMSLFVSEDGGATWISIGGCGWSGGPQAQKNNATPTWSCTIGNLQAHAGKRARGEFTVQPQKTVGLSVTF